MSKPLDYFGEFLMTRVRDEAIEQWDMTLHGKMKDPESKEYAKAFKAMASDSRAIVESLIPKIVDTTLHHLLWALEQDEQISLTVEAGGKTIKRLQDESDGLSGETQGANGWVAKFSKQRKK